MSRLKERLSDKLQTLPEEISVIESTSDPIQPSGNAVIRFPDRSTEVSIVPDFAITLNEARQRIQLLQDFVREMMVQGVDYGNIPGCDKPSLFKPGAEKLCDIFGFSKTVEILHRVEDWQNGFIHYEVKVTLINKKSGVIEAEGLGSCNTKERKFAKQDPYSILNSVMKLSKKRSLVDAVLSATRSSGIFTQDMEDYSGTEDTSRFEAPVPASSSDNPPAQTPVRQQPSQRGIPITPQQLSYIENLVEKANLSSNQVYTLFHNMFDVHSLRELTKTQASEFITLLKSSG